MVSIYRELTAVTAPRLRIGATRSWNCGAPSQRTKVTLRQFPAASLNGEMPQIPGSGDPGLGKSRNERCYRAHSYRPTTYHYNAYSPSATTSYKVSIFFYNILRKRDDKARKLLSDCLIPMRPTMSSSCLPQLHSRLVFQHYPVGSQ